MNFLSTFSGIEAASVAWGPLGWKAWAFSEIDPFASAVLAHHYPDTPNLGDIKKFKDWPDANLDLLCGGSPCQSFSVAGLRKGLDDPRGNLMFTFGAVAAKYRPRWLVWENVPGVLSSNEGRDFGAFLRMLGQLGYGFAYRVLDAQHFGVPQRRRRVFVVGCLGDWRAAAAVLFERHSLSGHSAPRREAGKAIAPCVTSGAANGGAAYGARSGSAKDNLIVPVAARCITTGTGRRYDPETETILPVAFDCKASGRNGFGIGEVAPTMRAMAHANSHSNGGGQIAVAPFGTAVRRLTPIECERLQGFPDNYTLIPSKTAKKLEADMLRYLRFWRPDITESEAMRLAKDGPRYKALGNSWAVPVVRWIGERIAAVDALPAQRIAA